MGEKSFNSGESLKVEPTGFPALSGMVGSEGLSNFFPL